MPRSKSNVPKTTRTKAAKEPIENFEHKDKQRTNNSPVGLVTPETDRDAGKQHSAYDPHLDPQLVWAGKAEHTSFEVPTVSLHVHERIDERTILAAVNEHRGFARWARAVSFAPSDVASILERHDHPAPQQVARRGIGSGDE